MIDRQYSLVVDKYLYFSVGLPSSRWRAEEFVFKFAIVVPDENSNHEWDIITIQIIDDDVLNVFCINPVKWKTRNYELPIWKDEYFPSWEFRYD